MYRRQAIPPTVAVPVLVAASLCGCGGGTGPAPAGSSPGTDAGTGGSIDDGGCVVPKPPLCPGGRCEVTLASCQDWPAGIAVNANYVYWVSGGASAADGTIMRVPIGGGSPVVLASGLSSPAQLALDSTDVYWTNAGTEKNHYADGTVMKMPLAGGKPTTLAVFQAFPIVTVQAPRKWSRSFSFFHFALSIRSRMGDYGAVAADWRDERIAELEAEGARKDARIPSSKQTSFGRTRRSPSSRARWQR